MMMPIQSYFEFQKGMVDYFAKRDDCEFFFKLSDTKRRGDESSIIPYIMDKNIQNIHLVQGSINEFFDRVDVVLLDCLTTAFFEAIAYGKPVFALNSIYMGSGLSPLYEKYFGRLIKTFRSNEEGIRIIDKFLNDDWNHYRTDFKLKSVDIVSLFLKILDSSHSRAPKQGVLAS